MCRKNVKLEGEDEMLLGKVLACNSYILPPHNKFNQINRSITQINIMQNYKNMLFPRKKIYIYITYQTYNNTIFRMDYLHYVHGSWACICARNCIQ